ncbi:hypothetical protein AeMF1_008377 [Aphanomyces euteiches]|nr:hypothetical protein AeMF1_015625 [Aphanomyces euteiches]KAH9118522.1 hypothetical protein AeMF1_008377 [Aphanomyces euteiches]
MLGVSSLSLNYTSGGLHTWFYNNSTTPAITGTQQMQLSTGGNLNIANGGVHCYGLNAGDLSTTGPGMHMHYSTGSSVGILQCFDYSSSQYKDINIQSSLFYKSSNGFWGVGTNNPGCPLEILGTGSQSTGSGFTFITSSSVGQATGFSNRNFSLKTSGGIMVASGEIDCLSDLRTKSDVIDLSQDQSERFVRNITPIEYSYKANPDKRHYGYGAQELVKHGLSVLVGATDSDEPLPEEIIECVNGDVIQIGSDSRLVVDVISIVPLLHSALKRALKKIDNLTQVVGKQQMQMEQLTTKPVRRTKSSALL